MYVALHYSERRCSCQNVRYNVDMKVLALALAATLACVGAMQDPKGKTMGNPSAPLRLELYADFTCPHCKLVHEQVLPQIVRDYVIPGKAYLVFRDFVLNGPGHQYSRDAATIAAAAARLGRYQEAADALFKAQSSWTMTGRIWDIMPAAFGPEDLKKLQAMAKDPGIPGDVQKDQDAGMAVPVNSTPTMVIVARGKKQPWTVWTSYPLLKNYLDSLLSK
jgi:protein-disulfide isomerase